MHSYLLTTCFILISFKLQPNFCSGPAEFTNTLFILSFMSLNPKLAKNMAFLNFNSNYWKTNFLHTILYRNNMLFSHLCTSLLPLKGSLSFFKVWLSYLNVPFGCLQLLNAVFLLSEGTLGVKFCSFVHNKNTTLDRLFWLWTQYKFKAEQFLLSLEAHSSNNFHKQ